jgi:transposase
MVRRMAGSHRISASALSKEVDVPQATLSRWLQRARSVGRMSTDEDNQENAAKSPRQWSAEEKFQVVLEAAALAPDELGAFLRRKGLHAAQLEEWRALATAALANPNKGKGGKRSAESKRIAALERELLRKDKALAEVTALLALKKKLEALLGEEGDDTDARSGK